jgi:hypothetical protein
MVHPSFKLAGGELPQSLTPVYSTVAQLPQAYLRKAVQSGLGGLSARDISVATKLLLGVSQRGIGLRGIWVSLLRRLEEGIWPSLHRLEQRAEPL